MTMFILVLVIINFAGIWQYGWWSVLGAPHKQQMLVDFFCPVGAIISRLTFKFDMKTNRFAYIYGILFEIMAGLFVFFLWR